MGDRTLKTIWNQTIIVTEDSDYGVLGINEQQRRVFAYMKAMMGLHVYNSKMYLHNSNCCVDK